MKDLGALHHFLGVTVERRLLGLFLHQQQYTVDILERAGMVECKPCATPVDTQGKLSAAGPPRRRSHRLTEYCRGPSLPHLHQARHRLRRPTGVPPHARPLGAASHRDEADPAVLAGHSRLRSPSTPVLSHGASRLHRCRLGGLSRHASVHLGLRRVPRQQPHLVVVEAPVGCLPLQR
jgi:hypothetical protein